LAFELKNKARALLSSCRLEMLEYSEQPQKNASLAFSQEVGLR